MRSTSTTAMTTTGTSTTTSTRITTTTGTTTTITLSNRVTIAVTGTLGNTESGQGSLVCYRSENKQTNGAAYLPTKQFNFVAPMLIACHGKYLGFL